jgi:2-polyprenyl-3-methyl-5-hydroxy-6-metoxy-1,4-benzoquinol methylase
MFHVEHNQENLHCASKDYLVTGESFQVYLDKNKTIGQTFPFPKKVEMNKYYNSKEYSPHHLNKRTLLGNLYLIVRKHMNRRRLIWLKSSLKKSSLVLDYGCGSGEFVRYLRSKSVAAYGYDPNLTVNSDESHYFIKNDTWKKNTYDIIFLWHVLEHTHDPFLLLQSLKKRLTKNGKIFIAIPNFKSYDSKHYGEYWAGYDLPRHLWHFSRKSINKIAKKNNFKVHKEKGLYFDAIYVSFLSEKYKSSCFPLLKGFLIGVASIIKSFFSKESSSLLFVINKI